MSDDYTCKTCGKKGGFIGCDECHPEEVEKAINEMKEEVATVRVFPKDEDDEDQEDRAMEYEYEDYDGIIKFLNEAKKAGKINEWQYVGNAISLKYLDKKFVNELKIFLKKKAPGQKIGIEWDYWVDD
jgi:hypothetical protein